MSKRTYTITVDEDFMDDLFGAALSAVMYTRHTWSIYQRGLHLERDTHPLPFDTTSDSPHNNESTQKMHYEESSRILDFVLNQRKANRAA